MDEERSSKICKHCDRPLVSIGRFNFCPICGVKKPRDDKIIIKLVGFGLPDKMRTRSILKHFLPPPFYRNPFIEPHTYLTREDRDYFFHTLEIKGIEVHLLFQYTIGGYTEVQIKEICRGARGGIIFFFLENKESFEAIETWYTELIQNCRPPVEISLVGLEKTGKRAVVSVEKINQLTTQKKIPYYKISSSEALERIVTDMLSNCIASGNVM